MTQTPMQGVLAAVSATGRMVECKGGYHMTRCPAHQDDKASLSISEGSDGRVLLKCHAGCGFSEIRAALGLPAGAFFAGRDAHGAARHPASYASPADARAPVQRSIAATYRYTDEDGNVLFESLRFEPKDFRQRRPDASRSDGWSWNLTGVRRVLYRLPDVVMAVAEERKVYFVEGEKDADSLVGLGVCATTNPGGAGKWRPEFTDSLRGAHVVILPDNDEPGRQHAEKVAAALHDAGCRVRVVHLPGLPPKGDVSDWLAGGGTREQLERLAQDTALYPAQVPPEDGLPDPFCLPTAPPAETLLEAPRFRFVDDEELENRTLPEALVAGILYRGTLLVLYGPPGCGKSFLGIALAMSVATGQNWFGQPVRRGPVVYVAAEASAGIGVRLKAWKSYHARPRRAGVQFLTEAVQLFQGDDVRAFVEQTQRMEEPPVLIVVDTLAESTVGADENATRDMNVIVSSLNRIRRSTGAAVLVIHHTRKDGEIERGNTTLRGAADTMLKVAKEDDRVLTLSCDKQRDAEPFAPIRLVLKDEGPSCVAIPAKDARQVLGDRLSQNERQVLESLTRDFFDDGAPSGRLSAASGVSERSFHRAVKSLVDAGYVARSKVGRNSVYSITAKGATVIADTCQTSANHLPGSSADVCQPTPPFRGSGGMAGVVQVDLTNPTREAA